MLDFYRDALRFAAIKHGDQKRRYTGEPYITHLIDVAAMTERFGGDNSMIKAAILHDVLEDTTATFDEVKEVVGPVAAGYVLLLTDCGKECGNRAARKAVDRARIACAPREVQDIKLADLIDNTRSIVRHDPDFAVVYMKEKRLLLDALSAFNPMLKECAEMEYERAQKELERQIAE